MLHFQSRTQALLNFSITAAHNSELVDIRLLSEWLEQWTDQHIADKSYTQI